MVFFHSFPPPVRSLTTKSLLVIESGALSPSEIQIRAKIPAAELESRLGDQKYVRLAVKEITLFFSPGVWGTTTMEESLRMYGGLASAIHSDGTVDLTQDEVLSDFVKECALAQGYQIGDQDQATASVDRTVTLQVGSKSIEVRCQPPSSKGNAVHDAPPLRAADDEFRRRYSGKRTLVFPWNGGLAFYAYGPLADDRAITLACYKKATETLGEHYADFRRKRLPLIQSALDKMTGYSLKDLYGKSFDSLPADLQQAITSTILHDYESFGYGTSQAALQDVRNSTLSGSDAGVVIFVGSTAQGSAAGYRLP